MTDRREPLINPTWEQMCEREPLLAFSFYLSGRANVLLAVGEEIVQNLDVGFLESIVDGGRIGRAESLMWLWSLGAYEVARTMCQAKGCFSPRVQTELIGLKRMLSAVRMPAAKMEKPGTRTPVSSDRSPAGWDVQTKDLLVGDPTDPHSSELRARPLLSEFARVFGSIRPEDVLARHEDSYGTA